MAEDKGRWFELAERYRDERDEALAQVEKVTAESAAEKVALEADLTKQKLRADTLAGVMREITNNPLMDRERVQSRLLIALERHGDG